MLHSCKRRIYPSITRKVLLLARSLSGSSLLYPPCLTLPIYLYPCPYPHLHPLYSYVLVLLYLSYLPTTYLLLILLTLLTLPSLSYIPSTYLPFLILHTLPSLPFPSLPFPYLTLHYLTLPPTTSLPTYLIYIHTYILR